MHQESYKRLMNCSFFGYAYHRVILDDQGRPEDYEFLEVNAGFEKMTGLKAENILGRRVTEVLPGIQDSSFDWIGFYGRIALEQTEEEFEQYSEPLKRWYKVSAYSPKKHHFVTIIQDITSEKEYALQMERFFSVNLDLLCIADTAGNFIKVNAEWENVLGYTVQELEERTFLEFVHPDDIDSTLAAMADLDNQKCVLQFVNRYRCKDGSYRYIEWRSQPHGSLIYAAARDVSDRVQMEEELMSSREQFELAIRGSNDGIWDWDLRTNSLYLSPKWKEQLGYADHEIPNDFSSFESRLHPEDKPKVMETVHGYLQGQSAHYALEFRIRHKNGEYLWILARGEAVRDEQGIPIRMAGSHTDITERKRAEDEIRQANEQLEMTNAQKDKLFSIISHDLKSPMSGLISSTELLSSQVELLSQEDIRDIAAELHTNARNTYALLEELLQWSQMSQGVIEYTPEPCSFSELVNIGLNTLKSTAKDKDIVIITDFPDDLAAMVDQSMIKTVMRNILSNAIKFSHQGCEVLIRARHSEGKITMAVKDNGIGMSEEVKSMLFTVNKAKQQLGTDGEKGTGLGLMLCKQFIEQHGEKLWVESEPGKGTTVFFTLQKVSGLRVLQLSA